jgi:hypothetical protein
VFYHCAIFFSISSTTGYFNPTFKLSFTNNCFSSHLTMQLLNQEETKDSVQNYQQKKKGLRTIDVYFICGEEKCLKGGMGA